MKQRGSWVQSLVQRSAQVRKSFSLVSENLNYRWPCVPIVAVNGCQCTSASMIRAASTSRRSSDSGPKYELMHTLFKQWKKIIRIKLGIFIHCSKDQCICYLGHKSLPVQLRPQKTVLVWHDSIKDICILWTPNSNPFLSSTHHRLSSPALLHEPSFPSLTLLSGWNPTDVRQRRTLPRIRSFPGWLQSCDYGYKRPVAAAMCKTLAAT